MGARIFGSAVLLGVLLAGCASGMRQPSGLPGAPTAPAAVESFLRLAADHDYSGMGWIFGTADGPINELYPLPEVELRMVGLADPLVFDSFVLGNGLPVPGRTVDALRFNVILTAGPETYEVPFTTVQGPEGRWFVEQLDFEAVLGR